MSTLSGACVLCVLVPHLMGSAGCSNDRQQAQRRLRRKSSGPKLRPGLNQPMRGPLNQMRIGQPRSQRLGAESSEAASLLAQVKRLVPDRRCLRRADSAPTEVASGRTRVRAKPGIRLLARIGFTARSGRPCRASRPPSPESQRSFLRQPRLAQALEIQVECFEQPRIAVCPD